MLSHDVKYIEDVPSLVRREFLVRYSNEIVDKMVTFSREYFGLPTNWNVNKRFYSLAENRKKSKGGLLDVEPYINLSLRKINCGYFAEYSEYGNDPEIGHIQVCGWRKYLISLIAHEIAHVVQFSFVYLAPQYVTVVKQKIGAELFDDLTNHANFGGHGKLFQYVYRIFRNNFVNDVPDFMGENYNVVTIGKKKNIDADQKKIYVNIKQGSYRNLLITGTYELVKDFTIGKNSAYIVINYHGSQIRVTFLKDEIFDQFKNKLHRVKDLFYTYKP